MNKKNEKQRIGRSLKGFAKYLLGVQERTKNDWYTQTYIRKSYPDSTVIRLMRNAYNAGKRTKTPINKIVDHVIARAVANADEGAENDYR